jgi:hypothetical protein
MSNLWSAAVDVLQGNWNGVATLPSRNQYPHQWSWDSAFISIGWSRIEPARAQQELLSLFRGQWSSGRVPQIVFSAETVGGSYFPGPDFWQSGAVPEAPLDPTSGIVQPPVHARAVLTAYLADPDEERARSFLAFMYPRLNAWHRYLRTSRQLDGTGLASIVHPWESGLDNSPAWDEMLKDHEFEGGEDFVRRDLTHASPSNRPTDEDYQAYVSLARAYRDAGYSDTALPDHPFVVEDPLFNATFLDAELCCAAIAHALGQDRRPHLSRAQQLHLAMMANLWDEQGGCFRARDARTGQRSRVHTIGSLIPLLDPWLSPAVADKVTELALSGDFAGGCEYPMPSTALTSTEFDRRRYWRGPTWMNTNWLLWTAAVEAGATELAALVARSSLRLVELSGFREYFDPFDGAGLGTHQFSWTAALTLDFLSAGKESVVVRPLSGFAEA